MNVVERYLATYRHEPTDRAPIALSYFHAGFARKHFAAVADDRMQAGIERQTRYGFDPHLYVRGTGRDWWLALPDAGHETDAYRRASATWRVTIDKEPQPDGLVRVSYSVETPDGCLTCLRMQTPDDFGTIPEPFIKSEKDIELLAHRPEPQHFVSPDLIRSDLAAMGDRCWPMASIVGVWSFASFLRGPDILMYDLYDRPGWVKRLMGILCEQQVALVRAIASAGVDVTLRMDGSFVGFGLSQGMYKEFIQPYDARIVSAAHDAGLRLHYHICGKKNAFLDDVADTGIDALETLTPIGTAGDIDLAQAKRRIGDRVCLMGGFESHMLLQSTPDEIRAQVHRCMAQAGDGGGYILSPSGRIDPGVPEENLLAFTSAGREFGVRQPVT